MRLDEINIGVVQCLFGTFAIRLELVWDKIETENLIRIHLITKAVIHAAEEVMNGDRD